jgi:acyl dehydratase
MTRKTQMGTEFIGKKKRLSEARVLAFSGGRFNAPGWPGKNIHTDLKFAKSYGLPTRSASATQYMAYLVELMIDLFGEGWLNHGKMNLKFIAIVDVDDELVSKAVVTSKEAKDSKVSFTLSVWCENQRGDQVAIGTATGYL